MSKGLQVKRSTSQKVPKSKGLQKIESIKGIKESCRSNYVAD